MRARNKEPPLRAGPVQASAVPRFKCASDVIGVGLHDHSEFGRRDQQSPSARYGPCRGPKARQPRPRLKREDATIAGGRRLELLRHEICIAEIAVVRRDPCFDADRGAQTTRWHARGRPAPARRERRGGEGRHGSRGAKTIARRRKGLTFPCACPVENSATAWAMGGRGPIVARGSGAIRAACAGGALPRFSTASPTHVGLLPPIKTHRTSSAKRRELPIAVSRRPISFAWPVTPKIA